jgi:hypothetical protein
MPPSEVDTSCMGQANFAEGASVVTAAYRRKEIAKERSSEENNLTTMGQKAKGRFKVGNRDAGRG